VKPKVLKTEAEYEAALAEMATLMDAAPGSPDEEALELWGLLIREYEKEHYPVDLPDPIDAIRFRMEQAGLKPKDLIPYIGSQSKVSEVLNRKRRLSLTMIQALHQGLGIPSEVLLQQRPRPGARTGAASDPATTTATFATAGGQPAAAAVREEATRYSPSSEEEEQK
jgi:HTH-type transcriptional regulator / antitoxin HigA